MSVPTPNTPLGTGCNSNATSLAPAPVTCARKVASPAHSPLRYVLVCPALRLTEYTRPICNDWSADWALPVIPGIGTAGLILAFGFHVRDDLAPGRAVPNI